MIAGRRGPGLAPWVRHFSKSRAAIPVVRPTGPHHGPAVPGRVLCNNSTGFHRCGRSAVPPATVRSIRHWNAAADGGFFPDTGEGDFLLCRFNGRHAVRIIFPALPLFS